MGIKGKKFDTMFFKEARITLDVRYSKRENIFFVEFLNQTFSNSDIKALKGELDSVVRGSLNIIPIPVIETTLKATSLDLSFDYDRFALGVSSHDNKLMYINWKTYQYYALNKKAGVRNPWAQFNGWGGLREEVMALVENQRPVSTVDCEYKQMLIPYTEETWLMLQKIEQAIELVGKKFEEIFNPKILIEAKANLLTFEAADNA